MFKFQWTSKEIVSNSLTECALKLPSKDIFHVHYMRNLFLKICIKNAEQIRVWRIIELNLYRSKYLYLRHGKIRIYIFSKIIQNH